MSECTIPGTLDWSRLAVPAGVCATCWSTYVAKPTPLLYCKHLRTVARRTRGGRWKSFRSVTDDELRTLGLIVEAVDE